MENKSHDTQSVNSAADRQSKNKLTLPLIALCLSVLPVPIIIITLFGLAAGFAAVMLLPTLLSPVVGLVMGVIYLSKGKARTCRCGKILAVIAIALPLSAVVFVIIFFIGAMTGIIPLM